MEITICGTGYVGLVTAVCLAEIGHTITCVDTDVSKIELLRHETPTIYESGLAELMRKNTERITYTVDAAEAYRNAEVIFIGVGTPEKRDGSANLSYVFAAVDQIAKFAERDCVVVVKSTVPIGTNDKVASRLKEQLVHPVQISVASNPEFLAQGTAVNDTLHPSRIVIGAETMETAAILLKLYEPIDAPRVVTDRRSAEMIKYASNDFLALKISYINEIANLCETIGADVTAVAEGMGLDPRIGRHFLQAGIGYGGSCFPKDTKALHWTSSFYDVELKTVKAAIEVNSQQKLRLIKKARKRFDSFDGMTIGVLGLTFKPGTDDLREAPSLVNIPILLDDGAKIQAYDPIGISNFKHYFSQGIVFCGTPQGALQGADVCFIFTDWPEIKSLTAMDFIFHMKSPIVFDGRNCYDPKSMKGITYLSIGRPPMKGY